MPKLSTALRSLVLPAAAGAIIVLSAGEWRLPFVWSVLVLLATYSVAVSILTDPDMQRERRVPGAENRDRVTGAANTYLFLIHWTLIGLDVGRFHWTAVPFSLRIVGLAGYAVALAALLWAMRVNRFFSSVVRLQQDRGQYPITEGPYKWVRHPGYAAVILSFLCGGLAFGSWVAMLPLLGAIAVIIRRTLLEDRMLLGELEGYPDYARKVRCRLVPGIF